MPDMPDSSGLRVVVAYPRIRPARRARATAARHDPAWAKRWAPFIELLLRDPANWDRTDSRFPFLRYMDVYAGHSWANGPALFAEGNNQEASSEDTNFSAAAILWGSAIGDSTIRDMGIFLYTQQVQAIEQYWFDVDDAVSRPHLRYPSGVAGCPRSGRRAARLAA